MIALLAALLVAAPALPARVPPGVAVIANGGSTNATGWAVAVHPDGRADVYAGGTVRHVRVAPRLAQRLYADLATAGDLAALPAGRCMRSVSFGSRSTVAYRGRRSPDLNCPQTELERRLASDVDALATTSPVSGALPGRRVLQPAGRTPR